MLRFPLRLLAILALATTASAQTLEHTITLDDGDPSTPDNAFGVTLDPDGIHAYVALAGDFITNNDKVLKLDVIAGTVVTQGTVGFFPEDVAVTIDAAGQARHVYVTNSTDGTVSVLTPNLVPLSTVTLTTCFGSSFFAVFPFGILPTPDSSQVLVTTIGCGNLDLLDSDPQSPGFNTVAAGLNLPGGHGRATWAPYPIAVLATNTFASDFSYGEAHLSVVDVTNPGSAQTFPLLPTPPPGTFDSATDTATLPNGNVLVTVGFGQGGYLMEVNPASGAIVNSLDFLNGPGVLLHGLGLNPSGDLAALTFFNGASDVVFVDVPSFTQVGSVSTGSFAQPTEAVFTPDGSRVVVSQQGTNAVVVLKDVPGFDLELQATPVAPPGVSLELDLDGVEHGQPAAIFASLTGGGPQLVGGVSVLLSGPFWLFSEHLGDRDGDAQTQVTVPLGASGNTVWFQGVTLDRDNQIRLSNGAQTVIP